MADLQVELNRLALVRNASPNLLTPNQASLETDTTGWAASQNCTITRAVQGTLRLPGIAGNYVSTPDAVDISITGDIDLRCKVAMDSWTDPSASGTTFIGKWAGAGDRSYTFFQEAGGTGKLVFGFTTDGTTQKFAVSTVATGIPNGTVKWVRVTRNATTGANLFYLSDDGVVWTQLGAAAAEATTGPLFDSVGPLGIGGDPTSRPLGGYIYRAEVYNGIGGTLVAWFDATQVPVTDTRTPTTVSQSGRTWTLNGALWSWPLASDGVASLCLTSTTSAGATTSAITPTGLSAIPVVPGRTYSALADFRAGSTVRNAQVTIQWATAAGGFIQSDTSGSVADSTTAWTSFRGRYTAPATAAFASLQPGVFGVNTVGETLYIDRLSFYEGLGTSQYYPPTDTFGMLDAQGAANLWAGISPPNLLDLQGALNYKAGIAPPNLLDINGVLGVLGISGVPAASALVGVGNVLRMTGVPGNFVNTPYSAAIAVTGDIDIRMKLALDSWTPGQAGNIMGRRSGLNAWAIRLDPAGTLTWQWSADGTTTNFQTSSVSVPFTAGQTGWVRVTFAVSNGTTTFYTSTDGVNWTQLGTQAVFGSATSINQAVGVALEVGSAFNGLNKWPMSIFYAQVLNGINGTPVATFDASQVAVRGATTPSSFTQGNTTWTINGSNWWWDTSSVTTRAPNGVRLTGLSAVNISQPDSAANSVTGDLDLRVKWALDNWARGTYQTLLAKAEGAAGQSSYELRVTPTGNAEVLLSTDGTALLSRASSVIVPYTPGQIGWLRATVKVNNGSAGHDVTWYTSSDGVTWAQLGTVSTNAPALTLFDGTAPLVIGAQSGGGNQAVGVVYNAEVRNGIAGSVVASFNPNVVRAPTVQSPTTVPDASQSGVNWTINGSNWNWVTSTLPQVMNRYRIFGNGSYASTPDTATVSITGDIDLRAKVALDDWTAVPPVGYISVIDNFDSGPKYGYRLMVIGSTTSGMSRIRLDWGTGAVNNFGTSSANFAIAAGQPLWVRVTLAVATGVINYYTSTDGVTWTLISTATYGATSIADSGAVLSVGRVDQGFAYMRGVVFFAEVRNGINGTVAAQFDPSVIRPVAPTTPTTIPSRTGETWTLNGTQWSWIY